MSVFAEDILDGKNTPGSSTHYVGLALSPCSVLKRQIDTSKQVHGILLPATFWEDCSWLSVGLDWVLRFDRNNESRNFPSTKKEFEEGHARCFLPPPSCVRVVYVHTYPHGDSFVRSPSTCPRPDFPHGNALQYQVHPDRAGDHRHSGCADVATAEGLRPV